MPTAPNGLKRNSPGFVLGVFLCALLCVFAVAAKTALYNPHPHKVQVLTSTKVWKGSGTAADVADSVDAKVPAMLAVAALVLLLGAAPDEQKLAPVRTAVRRFRPRYVSPATAVRPPPTK